MLRKKTRNILEIAKKTLDKTGRLYYIYIMILLTDITMTLKDLRRARGMSLDDVKDKTGLSPTTISYVERGIDYPKEANRKKISQALGIDEANFDLLWQSSRRRLK